jgi:homoserine dehydrogenase
MKPLTIGCIGAGTVGTGVVKLLEEKKAFFASTLASPLHLHTVADTDPARLKALPIDAAQCTHDATDILDNEEIDLVIELIGGTGAAKDIIIRALQNKKHVVTANKALIAEHGPELFAAADAGRVSLFYEAAVGGGMPVIKTIRETLAANTINSIHAIINGTCNYILTQMEESGCSFSDALRQAQEKGFAEANPDLDIHGGDAGHKVAIMASLAFRGYCPFDRIDITGITQITADDIQFAAEAGYRIKLLGIIRRQDDANTVEARVCPVMLPVDHILSSVSHEFNAVLFNGSAVDDMLVYGKGAGEMPTASAVVGDCVDAARMRESTVSGCDTCRFYKEEHTLTTTPSASLRSRFYLRFTVEDKPGVLASISSICAKNDISIASVLQKEGYARSGVPVIILTHHAAKSDLDQALTAIEKEPFIKKQTQVIFIED